MNYDYEIYQIKEKELHTYGFFSFDFASMHGFSKDDYELKYVATAVTDVMSIADYEERCYVADMLFQKFNMDRPEDFIGHSLSVSDVVVLHDNTHDYALYCDSLGWHELSKNEW